MDFRNIKLTLIPSPPDPRDWKVEKIYKAIRLPAELDYRNEMLSVRDQGSQGSCAAMAAAAMKEWQERKDVGLEEYFSPQFIYNNRENPSSSGMYTRDVMRILSDLGDCREEMFTYGRTGKPPDAAYAEARQYPIGNYAFVDTIEGLKTALVENGPTLIAFPVYNFGGRFWKKEVGEWLLGYHMVLVVGYSDIKKNFIIRNSWGDDWAESGYTYFPYEDWGWQEEIATTVDTDSDNYIPPAPDNKSWFTKYWWIIAIVIAIGAALWIWG